MRRPQDILPWARRTVSGVGVAVLLAACSERGGEPIADLGACNAGTAASRTAARPVGPITADTTEGSCAIADQLAWVDFNMRDYYLFYDQVPDPRLSDFDDEDELIKALRVAPDRFSYVGDAGRNEAFFEAGEDLGYGWRLARREDGALQITLVEPESPLAAAGVRRGEIVRFIDGVDESTLTSSAEYTALLGEDDDSRTITLGVEDLNGVRRDVDVTRGTYSVRAVLDAEVLVMNGVNVGYLNFLTFIETARAEIADAFALFRAANVTELVVDLRFNGGGRIDVANELASRIVGSGGAGRDFTRFRLNDKEARLYSADALSLPFERLDDSLDLPRVYVLTSASTCSASEMVINGLEPFVDVVQIGGDTCGKPFGFSGRERCGKIMQAVEFEFVNDACVGGYADGLLADCDVIRDGVTELGDPGEPLLAAALGHIDTARCPIGSATDPSRRLRSGARTASGDWRQESPLDPMRSEIPLR